MAQLGRIDAIVAAKRCMGRTYSETLQSIKGLELPLETPWMKSVFWMYGVVLSEDFGMDAGGFAERLMERGIETRPFFLGMHEQPAFQERGLFVNERHPVAERLARQGLYLPSGLALTDEQRARIVSAVKEILQ